MIERARAASWRCSWSLSLVIGVLAALFPARRAARLDVLKAIATE